MGITIPLICFAAIFGLIFGSFFSVVVDRSLRNESIIFPRSHCPYCGKTIRFYDLIPLFSYFVLKGKCRYCRNKIPILNPLVEILTGASFALMFILSPTYRDFFINCGLFSLLLMVTLTDLKAMFIPNKIIISFTIYFAGIFFLYPHHFENALLGCLYGVLCPLIVWVIYPKGIGLGDIKLFGLLGFVLGPHQILTCIIIACMIGIIFFIICVLLIPRSWMKQKRSETLIPFAPYISLGVLMSYLFG